MDLSAHSGRTQDAMAIALGESDRAKAALERSWADFSAEPTPARQFLLLSAMAAELDSLAHLEIARKATARASRPRERSPER